MMKQVFYILTILSYFGNLYAQNENCIFVKGMVKGNQNYDPVANCIIHLILDENIVLQTLTDSSGAYEFQITNPKFRKGRVFIKTDQKITNNLNPCGFLESYERGDFILPDSINEIVFQKDFLLTHVNCHFNFPTLHFKKNSSDYVTHLKDKYDNSIDSLFSYPNNILEYYIRLLKEYPKIIVELRCHCSSDEKNFTKLSQLRAEKIISDLSKMGVTTNRIKGKAFGDKKPIKTIKEIKKVKLKEEKEALRALNRRCGFQILSWDFNDSTSKKTETPNKNSPIQKEGEQENLLPVKPDKKEN